MPKKNNFWFVKLFITWPIKFIVFLIRLFLVIGSAVVILYILQVYGVITVQIPVSGPSMLPTLPKEGKIPFSRIFQYDLLMDIFPQTLHKGDLVVFENEKIYVELKKNNKASFGFVKRIIATSGDIIEIRDGFVYLNGGKLSERYTLKPRSTFGGKYVQDCKKIKVPKGKVFVLGDNRKVSLDSRQIGLVSISDIQYYIPYDRQMKMFASKWRDTSKDNNTEHESLFDVGKYADLVNNERAKNNKKPLEYQYKLERTAKLRAKYMLTHNEFDSNTSKSGYSMKEAMNDVGYSNIIYGEFPMLGYYDADELFAAFLEQPSAREFLLNEDYSEIGISTFIGDLNNCPAQVVVQHLAGYIPPNYGEGEIANFTEAVAKLRKIQSGWLKLKDFKEFYDQHKPSVDRINEIISLRINRFESIITQMQANKWLTNEQNLWIKEDSVLSDEQNQIADKLNN